MDCQTCGHSVLNHNIQPSNGCNDPHCDCWRYKSPMSMSVTQNESRALRSHEAPLTFDVYSDAVSGFAVYPMQGQNLVYPAMGIVGEAGELCDKIKKHWRNKHAFDMKHIEQDQDGQPVERGVSAYNMSNVSLTDIERIEISKEIGDVLWYCNALALELGMTLGEIAENNYNKLSDRANRNVIASSGDNR